jgi:hypothetical protein
MGSHALLVDGIEGNDYVLVRDPLPELIGSAYKVPVKTFLNVWLKDGAGRGIVVE